MSDRPPQWGEPGYVPPPRPPPKPEPTLRPWQQRALVFAIILVALGQVAYYVGIYWGGTVCDTSPLYDHPAIAAAGFLVSVGALALGVGVVAWSWSVLKSSSFAMGVPIIAAVGLGVEMFLTMSVGCW